MDRTSSPVKHLVVLMLENRSYDRMFGYLKNGSPLSGQEYNLVDPSDPNSKKVYVSKTAGYVTQPNLTHHSPRTDAPWTLLVPGEAGKIDLHRGLLKANPVDQWLQGLAD
jgi:phospholipase C